MMRNGTNPIAVRRPICSAEASSRMTAVSGRARFVTSLPTNEID